MYVALADIHTKLAMVRAGSKLGEICALYVSTSIIHTEDIRIVANALIAMACQSNYFIMPGSKKG